MTTITAISEFLTSNIYLYICILLGLAILSTILFIIAGNQKNRKKIKDDFVEATKLEEELENDNKESTNELENILKKMQEDINVTPEDVVKKFEEEQEEKAIISYQELVDSVKAGKIEIVDDEESDIDFVKSLELSDEQEPIMAIEPTEEKKVTPEMVREAIETISNDSVKEEPKKFKNSDFISPIYGVMNNTLDYPRVRKAETLLDIMNTRDYNELTKEIERQEEFLKALKEFRNNLQ